MAEREAFVHQVEVRLEVATDSNEGPASLKDCCPLPGVVIHGSEGKWQLSRYTNFDYGEGGSLMNVQQKRMGNNSTAVETIEQTV